MRRTPRPRRCDLQRQCKKESPPDRPSPLPKMMQEETSVGRISANLPSVNRRNGRIGGSFLGSSLENIFDGIWPPSARSLSWYRHQLLPQPTVQPVHGCARSNSQERSKEGECQFQLPSWGGGGIGRRENLRLRRLSAILHSEEQPCDRGGIPATTAKVSPGGSTGCVSEG